MNPTFKSVEEITVPYSIWAGIGKILSKSVLDTILPSVPVGREGILGEKILLKNLFPNPAHG